MRRYGERKTFVRGSAGELVNIIITSRFVWMAICISKDIEKCCSKEKYVDCTIFANVCVGIGKLF